MTQLREKKRIHRKAKSFQCTKRVITETRRGIMRAPIVRAKLLCLLLVIITPCLVTTQTIDGQTVTNTTVRVVTSLATSTRLRSAPIFPIPPQLGAITIPPTHGVCGVYFIQAFNATAGDIISGDMTADNPVDLYIMAGASFRAWNVRILVGGICTPTNVLLTKQNVTSWGFRVPVLTNGGYVLVLNNLSTLTVNANLSLNKAASAPVTVTVTGYSTMPLLTQSGIQTMIQASTVQAATPTQSNWVWAAAIIIIAILAVVSYLVTKRKQHESTGSKRK